MLWAVNLGCLGFHVWPYLAADPGHTDELRIDLHQVVPAGQLDSAVQDLLERITRGSALSKGIGKQAL